MKRLLLLTLLSLFVSTSGLIQGACAPKTLSSQAQVAYTADQIVKRLGEVENAVIAACNAGTGPTCATGAPISTDTSRALVQAILSAVATLKASPAGWQQTLIVAWSQAKLQPALMAPAAKGYVLAIDALLGVN